MSKAKTLLYAWWIWLIAALFYGIEFFQRVSPTVMAKPIMHSFHIDATVLGSITSLYLYAYAAAQIPVGSLLDRFGVRRPLTIACLAISIGSLLFALGQQLFFLAIARVLIGFGSAFAFIGTLKLVSSWFPQRLYPVMVGLTNTLGVVGAIFGEGPFAAMVEKLGWQHSLLIISIIGLAISALIFIGIKDHPLCLKEPKNCQQILSEQQDSLWGILKEVLACRQTWLTALYAGLMVAPIIAFAELWAVPFLETAYHLSAVTAADINTAIFIGIGVGGPLNGLLSRIFKRTRTIMAVGNLLALALLMFIIFENHFSKTQLFILMCLFGFFTSSMLLAFTLNKKRHPLSHNATVAAVTNMMIMLIGAVYQPLIGYLLDHLLASHIVGRYNVSDYHHALLILPLTLALNLVLLSLIRRPPKGEDLNGKQLSEL